MKQLKRKRGRTKKAPQSPAQLKEEARERIRQSAVRRAAEEAYELPLPPKPEEVIEEASAVTRKHRYTKEEMTELKQKLDFIYTRYIEEQQAEEAETNRELNEKLIETSEDNSKLRDQLREALAARPAESDPAAYAAARGEAAWRPLWLGF